MVLGAAASDFYFTSAYFAIRAPRVPGTRTRGPIRVHKALAWVHGPGMILTPVLGAMAYAQGSSPEDRKSTRLNSSHLVISYAVFCLKKKKKKKDTLTLRQYNIHTKD